MRLASQILSGAVVVAQRSEPAPPTFAPAPAPEMWEIGDTSPGLRCQWCASDDMQRHWLTRSKQRVCLRCKTDYGIERGCRQISQAEALRAVDARLEALTSEELSALKLYADFLKVDEWEDAPRGSW